MSETALKDVYTISESGGEEKNRWTKIGVGFVNKDKSINVILDALPANGKIHIRERFKKTQAKGESL